MKMTGVTMVDKPTRKEVAAVALAMLYKTHPEDVTEAFTVDELQQVAGISEKFQDVHVEYIYRAALGFDEEKS